MNRASAPQYDRFKLIVTAILLAILILMLLRGCATNTMSAGLTETTVAPDSSEAATSLPSIAESVVSSNAIETFTPFPISPTLALTITEIVPTQTSPAAAPTETVLTPAASATIEATTTIAEQTTPTAVQDASCNTSVPSRLTVGQKARVVQRLNMRNDASINAKILRTNPTNTQVEIIGGPVCTPVGDRAYLWWQIRLPDGMEGWSAESPLNEAGYLLELIP